MSVNKLSDKEFKVAVAKQVAEMGWSGFMDICDNDKDEATQLAEGGWSSIYGYVDDMDIDKLRDEWSHLEDDEDE